MPAAARANISEGIRRELPVLIGCRTQRQRIDDCPSRPLENAIHYTIRENSFVVECRAPGAGAWITLGIQATRARATHFEVRRVAFGTDGERFRHERERIF